MNEFKKCGWNSPDNPPDDDRYILLSYGNASLPDIGQYRDGDFYPGDEDRSCTSYGFDVNGWSELPEPVKNTALRAGDEIIWNDGSLSVVLAVRDTTFLELTQFGNIFEQCLPEEGWEPGWKKTGRWFDQVDEMIRVMQLASKVDE